jgi:hypothetical protein
LRSSWMCLSRPWRAKHVVNERDGCVGKVVRQADGKWCVKQIKVFLVIAHSISIVTSLIHIQPNPTQPHPTFTMTSQTQSHHQPDSPESGHSISDKYHDITDAAKDAYTEAVARTADVVIKGFHAIVPGIDNDKKKPTDSCEIVKDNHNDEQNHPQ